MAVSNVELRVDARNAIAALQRVNTASTQAETATQKLKSAFATAGQVQSVFSAKVANTEAAIRKQIAALREVQSNVRLGGALYQKAGKQIAEYESKLQNANRTTSNAATALAALGEKLVIADVARRYFKGFNEAEQAAAAVRTLGVDSQALQQRLLSLSNSLGGLYSQTQLLAAAYDVASSGFADTASNAKILEAAAYGATGGLSDINTVGNAVTSVLNAYGKSADEAGKLVDGFIQTQNDGKIILNEYATQIGRLAPTAAASGVGIEQLNAAIATITAQGVPVEATFTGLNQALVSILKPSQEAEKLAKGLGIQFNEAGLKAKGFGGLLQEVKQKTGGSTTALVQLFGSVDAVKAVLPLTNDNLVSFNKNLARQANASGVAEDATKELGGTVSSQITKMVNQIGNLSRALDQVLGPTFGSLIGLINIVIAKATEGIMVLGQMFSMNKNTTILKTAIESGDVGRSAADRVLPGAVELIGEKRTRQLQQQSGGFGRFDSKKFTQLLAQQPEIKNLLGTNKPTAAKPSANGGLTAAQQASLDSLLQGGGTRGGGGGGGGRSSATKAANDAKRTAEQIQQQLKEADDLNVTLRDRLAITQTTEPIAKRMLEYDIKRNEIARNYDELKKAAKTADERTLIDANFILENSIAQVEYEQQMNDLQNDRLNALHEIMNSVDEITTKTRELTAAEKQQLDLAESLSTTFGQGLTGAFDALISGSDNWGKSLQDIASGVLIDIANQLLRIFVIEQAISAIKGILSPAGPSAGGYGALPGFNSIAAFRANGGSVTAGKPYMVGERGPELFMPGRSGGIAPANSFGGGVNVVVNVDATGSNVQGDQSQAKQLGGVISAAVQAELVKQKRPGGLLA